MGKTFQAFTDRQLESYLQPLQKLTQKHLQTWAQQGDMELHAEFKKRLGASSSGTWK